MAGGSTGAVKITVIGEALIDLVPGAGPLSFRAHPGGSPYNVAIGLARLGCDTALMARLAGNAFGAILRDRAAAEGIGLDCAPRAHEPTTLAVVTLDEQAGASYDFYTEGTADWQWTAAEIARLPAGTAVLHFGSLASWTPPGDERIGDLARSCRDRGVLVSYDPNLRPSLLSDRVHAQRMTERSLGLAHLAKASAEDIAWLYPDRPAADVAAAWLGLGATVVVITDSARGADAYTAAGPPLHCPARDITVADTVGAGDSLTAGLLASLIARGLHTPASLAAAPADQLAGALADAISAAAVTCQRPGADPPARAELPAGWGR